MEQLLVVFFIEYIHFLVYNLIPLRICEQSETQAAFLQGDVLTTTCVYDTMERANWTWASAIDAHEGASETRGV